MEELKERIRREGVVASQQVLKLDAILNHQIDPQLTMQMGREFAARFAEDGVTRVITVESSGIPVAFAAAYELGVPMVFARRKKTLLADPDSYFERIPSFTKGIVTDLMLPKRFIKKEDRVLLIDDIIANGDAARGLVKIIGSAEATLVGAGIVVEKCFQSGARMLREQGIRLESLVRIESLGEDGIVFAD
ncbi:xanthine phosphoribosyltransferase [Saccharibacillus sp. CPCC 101409]|uniref:xanthine phosphoribosyltransferase n=1 Tax=Saccharibacillus sp. CPCC 101409 TaxID=3058041 RepID=UPI00267215F7|nr:xanthine phosphoribosyltransferase [Saccharibacillus sp. CPCC 101409]MDO3410883.1 xanthine phosphoribosyltransferase [Saccharibacillus sp. CPCC 101409]